jgi:phosphoglycolate phosphatase
VSETRKPPMPYRLVIFDFDGTLADSAAWFGEVFNDVADRYQFRKVGPEEIEELRGQSSRAIVRQLGIPFWKLPLIAGHMRQLSKDAAHRIALFPGVATMLQGLDERGMQIGLASSNAEETIRQVIGARVAACVDHFECGASMFGKARRIKRILTTSGVPAGDAIFIGDETRDIEAAHQAGVAGAAVLWGYAKPAAFEGLRPTATFATVGELANFLTR